MKNDDLIWTGDRFVKRHTLHKKYKPLTAKQERKRKQNRKYLDKWGTPFGKVSQDYINNPQKFKGYGN